MWIRTDKGDGTTEQVTEARVRQILTGFYHNVNLAVRSAKESGLPVESSFALYHWKAGRKEIVHA